jgi:hypothetical protein
MNETLGKLDLAMVAEVGYGHHDGPWQEEVNDGDRRRGRRGRVANNEKSSTMGGSQVLAADDGKQENVELPAIGKRTLATDDGEEEGTEPPDMGKSHRRRGRWRISR